MNVSILEFFVVVLCSFSLVYCVVIIELVVNISCHWRQSMYIHFVTCAVLPLFFRGFVTSDWEAVSVLIWYVLTGVGFGFDICHSGALNACRRLGKKTRLTSGLGHCGAWEAFSFSTLHVDIFK